MDGIPNRRSSDHASPNLLIAAMMAVLKIRRAPVGSPDEGTRMLGTAVHRYNITDPCIVFPYFT